MTRAILGMDKGYFMKNLILRWWKEERGATVIEYCLIAVGICIGLVATVYGIGDDLVNLFDDLAGRFSR